MLSNLGGGGEEVCLQAVMFFRNLRFAHNAVITAPKPRVVRGIVVWRLLVCRGSRIVSRCKCIHSFCSLFQSEFSRQCDLLVPLSVSSSLSFP